MTTSVLVGLLGGVIGVVVTLFLNARRERRSTRAAARMVLADLEDARDGLTFALDENSWGTLDRISLPSWSAAVEALAAGLTSSRWEAALEAARDLQRIHDVAQGRSGERIIPSTSPGAPPEADEFELRAALESCEKAIEALSPVGHWATPATRLKHGL